MIPLTSDVLNHGTQPIHALLVDDNEQWGTFVGQEIERQDSNLQVTVVTSATEALLTIRERGEIDCVIADYRMPEIGGIELLERVREEYDELPFILITGEGSEAAASQAIGAGVTDYLKKDPRVDQVPLLVGKIRSAVSQYRLRRVVEESEHQYRTVTEQINEAILIVYNDRVVYCNRGMEELVGIPRDEIIDHDLDWESVHPDDLDRCRTIYSRWKDGSFTDELHPVRIRSSDGLTHHCELTGSEITHENERALLVVIRDITHRIAREHALKRQRSMNQTVQELLISAHTREAFEREIVEVLHADGYPLVWIGEPDEEEVRCREAAGVTSYLDDLSLRTDIDADASEPVIWGARSGAPQFVEGFTGLFDTSWCTAALDHGLLSGAGIPLRYNDVTLGVLGVYSATADAFTDDERLLLSELAERLAFAIHNFERDRSLTSDHVVEAVLRVDGSGHCLGSVLSRLGGRAGSAVVTVRGTITTGTDRYIQYASLDGVPFEVFEAAANESDAVDSTTAISSSPESGVQIVISELPPEAVLAELGTIVRSTTVTATGASLRIEMSPKRNLRDIVDRLADRYGSISVESVTQKRREGSDAVPRYVDLQLLTNKQATALRAAYHQGYFEQPRLRSAEEIAASLDIAHSTYLQHLRVAQRKLFSSIFE